MLAVGHDVLGVEFSVRDHLGERHHRRRVRADGIGSDHIHVGVLGGLSGCDATVDPDRLLFGFGNRCHSFAPILDLFCRLVCRIQEFLRLSSVQPRRDREGGVHAYDARIEVEFGNAFEATRRALLDAHAAALAVLHQYLIEAIRTRRTRDARLGADQVAVVAGVASAAAEAAVSLLDRLLFGESLDHFFLRSAPAHGRQQRLLDAREVREVRHVHAVQIHEHVDGDFPRLERLATHDLVEIEGYPLAVADRIHDHQRLTRAQLYDVAGSKEVRVAEASEAIDLDAATLGLELGGQPGERRVLSDRDDDIVDREPLGRDFSIDGDRRSVDCARELCREELQRFDLAVAEHGGHCPPVHQFHAFFEHVVQIFRNTRHLLRVGLHGNHGDFDRALPQGFAGAVDGRVSSADYGNARTQFHLRGAHPDVAQEGKPVKNAILILTFGSHAVGFREAYREDTGIVVLFQVVPGDVFSDFGVCLDRDSKFNETLDLAIKHVLGGHPIRDTAAIQTARLRRLFKNRHFVAEARKLVRGAVSRGTRSDNSDLFAVGSTSFDYVARQSLPEIAKKALDRADGDGLIVLSAVAGLFARVIADAAGDGRERHVFFN